MFGNFIYFILVLLIYLTYQPSEVAYFSGPESLLLFALLTGAFAGVTRFGFKRIERRLGVLPFAQLDALFHAAELRSSVLAVVVFALDVYALGLPSFLTELPLVNRAPTLGAAVFLLLFMAHLCLVWGFAWDVYHRLYRPDIGRRAYVGANISFSVPLLLPWLLLSGITDVVNALPFERLQRFLATSEGQVAYFSTILLAIALTGPLLIRWFWRCTPLAAGAARSRIEDLCRRAGVGYADILSWPLFGGKMITAGVMGLVRRFRFILVTPGLLALLAPDEVDAVIAHEIGHVKKKHLLFYLMFFAGYLLLSYVTFDVMLYVMLFVEPVWWFVHHSGVNQATAASAVFSVLILVVFLVYFRFVFGFFMRNFERQADTYVFALFDSGAPLVSTLHKIALTSGQSAERPNWHHFSIRERIDFLRRCERSPSLIGRHDRRVRRSIAAYLAGVALLGAIGYQLNLGEVGSRLNRHFIEKTILREIERAPENPSLYSLLGDFHYSRKNYAAVRQAYGRALELKPDAAHTINNLAWLLATCEEEGFRDPPRALELALQAAALEPTAQVLDTLAESYYANRRFAEAVAASERALAAAKGERGPYEAQLRKFRRALANPENR
jgi:Zn-dependent protease with chaperone function